MRLKLGDMAPPFVLIDIDGVERCLTDYGGQKLLLSFHRYAACPLCNLHIHELIEAFPGLAARGLQMLAVFMSSVERVSEQYADRGAPFPIAADPDRKAYAAYGVERSLPGMLAAFVHPRAMKAFFSGFMPGKIDADTLTLPADFLIGPDLRIAGVHYSTNITQHMSLSQIRKFAEDRQV